MIDIIKEKSKSGLATYKHKARYIYSSYSPLSEAKKFVENQKPLKNIALTICGADYVNLSLTEEASIDLVISFEPVEFEKLSFSSKIVRAADPAAFENIVIEKEIDIKNITLMIWQPLFESFPDIYIPALEKIKNILKKLSLSKINAGTFGFLETKNFLINILKQDKMNILTAQSKKKENPALLISSGPSLADKIDFIKTASSKSVIFALPSAALFLDFHGIKPDFITAVDPGYATFYHLLKYKKRTNLITTLNVAPSILNLTNFNFIFFNYNNYFENIFYKECNAAESSSEGTVFINTLRLLSALGFTDVCVVGQDFGFYNNRTHVKEGFFEKEFLHRSGFTDTIEKFFFTDFYHYKKEHISLPGKTIETNTALKIYYEHFIKENFKINIFLPPQPFNPISKRFSEINTDFFNAFTGKNIQKEIYYKTFEKSFIEEKKNAVYTQLKKINDNIKSENIDKSNIKEILKKCFINPSNKKHIDKIKKLLRVIN